MEWWCLDTTWTLSTSPQRHQRCTKASLFNVTHVHWSRFISKAALISANGCFKKANLGCVRSMCPFLTSVLTDSFTHGVSRCMPLFKMFSLQFIPSFSVLSRLFHFTCKLSVFCFASPKHNLPYFLTHVVNDHKLVTGKT